MGLQLVESRATIPGALDSHETEPGPGNRPHPLLLSQTVQARLGLTKSARYGKVTLDDYNDHSLEVAREQGTGLFMIRIDHLSPEQFRHLPIRDLLSELRTMDFLSTRRNHRRHKNNKFSRRNRRGRAGC